MTDTAKAQTGIPAGPIRRWIMQHDDSWLFLVPYIGLAVLLSAVIGLFWLVAIVAAHFVLEWFRQVYLARLAGSRPGVPGLLLRVLWELKLDIALILFALALALYMELTLGLVGLGSAARAGVAIGARISARVAVLQRVLRAILLSLDDLAQVARVLLRRGRRLPRAVEPVSEVGWKKPWSRGDYVTLGFGALCLMLVLAAPLLTDHTFHTLLLTLAEELHPFPPLE